MRNAIRHALGDDAYRRLTLYPRILRMVVRPKPPRETAALPQLIKPGGVVFDVGANYGQYARVLSPLVGTTGCVYAFEPSRITMEGLRLMCRLLRLKNIAFHQLALSDQEGTAQLEIPIKDGGHLGVGLARLHSSDNWRSISEQVQVTTLDSFVERAGVRCCDFIKCDVEGAEYRVLQGALNTLRRHRPQLLIEIKDAQLRRYGNTAKQLVELLGGLRYDIYLWKDQRLARVDAIDASPNFIFIPRPG